MRDAQFLPVYLISLSAFDVLMFRDVNTIDALRGIYQSLSLVFVFLPFAYSQRFLG